jgi:hypothetical protein
LTVTEGVLGAKDISDDSAADPDRGIGVVRRSVPGPGSQCKRVGFLIVEVDEPGIRAEAARNESDCVLKEGVRVPGLVEELRDLIQERDKVDVELLLAQRSATM